MGIRTYDEKEAGNVALGQVGCFCEEGTTVITGKKVVAIQFLEDTAFTTLTPNTSSFVGTAGGNGDSVAGNTFPTGLTIFGQWTAITLASGSIIAYEGAF